MPAYKAYNDDDTLELFVDADDIVIFSENTEELQNAQNVFQEYCTTWRLTVTITKARILIISKGRPSLNKHF